MAEILIVAGAVTALCCTAVAVTYAIQKVYAILRTKPVKPLDLSDAERNYGKTAEEMIEEAQKILGMDVINDYNFAVVGNSGVGKSTLINRFRLLSDKQPGSAKVGETETTHHIRKYAHPEHPHIMMWDLPGAGTQLHPAATYFVDKMLFAFDCILIASSDRFLEVDFEIAKDARRNGRRCAFVRTKADVAVRSSAIRENLRMVDAAQRLREEVKRSLEVGLRRSGCSTEQLEEYHLFVICAEAFLRDDAYKKMDFDTMEVDSSLRQIDENKFLVYVANSVVMRQEGVGYLSEEEGGEGDVAMQQTASTQVEKPAFFRRFLPGKRHRRERRAPF